MVPLAWRRGAELGRGSGQERGPRGAPTHQLVVLQLLGVDAARVPDAAVHLGHAHTPGAEAVQVAHAVEPHVTEALRSEEQPVGSERRRRTLPGRAAPAVPG